MIERVSSFLKRHPRLFDGLVVALWTFFSLSDTALWEEEGSGRNLVVLIPVFTVTSLALFWRRRYPLEVFGFIAVLTLVLTFINIDDPVPASLICATYSIAAHTKQRRISILAVVAFVASGVVAVLITSPSYLSDTVVIALVLAIAWVIGDSLRTRRAYQQSIIDRAERAEALRDSLAHQAVAEERTRIARDLHDVVAHSMSLMVVQASAARRVAKTDPDASIAALQAIESVGRNSLDEMRRILGVLRGDEEAAAVAPQPDIAAIEPLADEFRAAGLPVEITHEGTKRPLPASIELTAFRIVQESLTNTLKHAGKASADVVLDYDESELRITVEDDGHAVTTTEVDAGGHKGHIGMRERVTAFGGGFIARPRLGGGYHVSATLPIPEGAS